MARWRAIIAGAAAATLFPAASAHADCPPGVVPQPEVCNCIDDDCDGVVDNDPGAPSNPTLCPQLGAYPQLCLTRDGGLCECAAPCGVTGGQFPCPAGQSLGGAELVVSGTTAQVGKCYCFGECSGCDVTSIAGECAPQNSDGGGSLPSCGCRASPHFGASCGAPCSMVACPNGGVCTDYGSYAGRCVSDSCVGVSCPDGQTCDAGKCGSIGVDSGHANADDGGPTWIDAMADTQPTDDGSSFDVLSGEMSVGTTNSSGGCACRTTVNRAASPPHLGAFLLAVVGVAGRLRRRSSERGWMWMCLVTLGGAVAACGGEGATDEEQVEAGRVDAYSEVASVVDVASESDSLALITDTSGGPVSDVVLADAGLFDCGGCACDGATHFCYTVDMHFRGLPSPDAQVCSAFDGGDPASLDLPAGCGPAPSCACLAPYYQCSCSDIGSGLLVDCWLG